MIALVSAPTNLGLRPPQPGAVPGTAKAPEALREAGLHRRFAEQGAADAGVVLPGRYVDDDATRAPGVVRNERAVIDHARRLADRIDTVLASGAAPLVVGGDCSVLLGAGLAMKRRDGVGLVHVDGHTDFRNPGNSDACASVAGEDLAAAVGHHWPSLSDIDGAGPYFDAARTAHVGCRDDDAELAEVRSVLGAVVPTSEWRARGTATVVKALRTTAGAAGYWLQVDVDVLDAAVMPAVDSPDPGGCTPHELIELLRALAPRAVGASITVYDPDLDPDGTHARLLTEVLTASLGGLGRELQEPRPGPDR
ncbi:arginase family protein [Curtobacterium sp. PhB171]|uniref:arginase family protein n=1 Tax=Curtobacterium sp. PhB171 TaxID=2485195 RepID=UPI000F464DAB|nr:arginase family protein [Curtobacterium sp. PhB171]ROQ16639.1 arginase [Curtobacterium sp. PhB171]ROQ25285.1 arginase [Curtobacterium sp. PhB170]ROS36737.1 arginase [Curtobacterium sp. PhB131]ROS71413.1 arginase [Curtobacterium sp. PhB141]